jgi:scavenger receptor class B, member 1
MKSYYPNFKWWQNPEPEILLNVYLFNITNSEDFIAGKDQKLKLQEIGPIVFQELAKNTDVVWHDENSTMSYTVTRRLVFKESANIEGILNQTIFAPNMALSAASYISNSFFLRRTFNVLLKSYSTSPVVSSTIYNYLFNLTDPVL